MRSTFLQLPTIALAILLFSSLILASSSPNTLITRDEDEGSSCSTEGQWHCMTNSFQRCAQGHFRIEREGDNDDDENRSDESRSNSASGVKLDSVVMLVVVSLLWVVLGTV
jgi:hypothetical protein